MRDDVSREPVRADEHEPGPGTLVAGCYRVLRPIGRGGMGAVWEACHTRLDARVALKFIAPALAGNPSALARFRREARAAATLVSPHIVRVSDFGLHVAGRREMPYIVMELLEGEDLHQRLSRGTLSLGDAARIVRETCKGLGVAHAAGIVHRDLKPRNLFLAKAGNETLLKILDFGCMKDLSALEAAERTETGQLLGSVHHMSPEQARGQPVGFDTDLWALGAVAYEALLGRLPFVGNHIGDVLVRIACDPAPSPSSIDRIWPVRLDRFFARAFAKNRRARFASADEMAAELEDIARSNPNLRASNQQAVDVAPPSLSSAFGRSASTDPNRALKGPDATKLRAMPAHGRSHVGPVVAPPRSGHRNLRWASAAFVLSTIAVVVASSYRSASNRTGSGEAPRASQSAETHEPPPSPATPSSVALPLPEDELPPPASEVAEPIRARVTPPTRKRTSASGAARPASQPAASAETRDKKYDPFSGIPVP